MGECVGERVTLKMRTRHSDGGVRADEAERAGHLSVAGVESGRRRDVDRDQRLTVDRPLAGAGLVSGRYLLVTLVFNPNASGTLVPTLACWQIDDLRAGPVRNAPPRGR